MDTMILLFNHINYCVLYKARRPETWRHSGGVEVMCWRWRWRRQGDGRQVGDLSESGRVYRSPSSKAPETKFRGRSCHSVESRHADHYFGVV